MAQLAMLIDLSRCLGCQACVIACKAGRELLPGERWIEIREVVVGRFPDLRGAFVPRRCFHCAEAACVQVCPTGALYKQDGFTMVDFNRCSGCGYCVEVCPFNVPRIVDGRVSKCATCLDLMEAGQEPWCVQTCPAGALQCGPREEILAEARARAAALQERYPGAQVYGETQMGGLGVILVLTEPPEVLGLPPRPQPPPITTWKSGIQPLSLGAIFLSALTSGIAFFIARRRHLEEKNGAAASSDEAQATHHPDRKE
ncbi:Formate dehydrogenase, nitrate-inducible, iron-sulfur subunit [Candidatus Thermoflexus japonica]|uniref:Formate dehydrogenase, nitrate-inducible, iron-sulfur subunit n=1 Tax=Candidatus Thermoflexus japonica TaxID=2035417 RepID=A0A2H5YA27_9CHLR|nr:Formate dehydrogenase, nitrate-inducible, iron-sulfur subunit [Candidatus Thermoflexus japonica]